jgi:hypothetical protein
MDLPDAKYFGFAPLGYDQWMFQPYFQAEYWNQYVSGKPKLVKDADFVSLRLGKDEYLDPASLEKLAWSRPLSIHPFLLSYRCYYAGSGTEIQVLRTIAASLGGKLLVNKKSYTFALDYAAVRRRWIERERKSLTEGTDNEYTRAAADLAVAILKEAPDEVIAKALAEPGAMSSFDIAPGTRLRALARARIEARRNAPPTIVSGPDYTTLVDLDGPWRAELRRTGGVGLLMIGKDGRTQIHF